MCDIKGPEDVPEEIRSKQSVGDHLLSPNSRSTLTPLSWLHPDHMNNGVAEPRDQASPINVYVTPPTTRGAEELVPIEREEIQPLHDKNGNVDNTLPLVLSVKIDNKQ